MTHTQEFNCLNTYDGTILNNFWYLPWPLHAPTEEKNILLTLWHTCQHCAKISISLGQLKCYYLHIYIPKLIPCYEPVAN